MTVIPLIELAPGGTRAARRRARTMRRLAQRIAALGGAVAVAAIAMAGVMALRVVLAEHAWPGLHDALHRGLPAIW